MIDRTTIVDGHLGRRRSPPLVEGRVRLDSGAPVPGEPIMLLFDLTDLGTAPLAATTDRSGRFTLPTVSGF